MAGQPVKPEIKHIEVLYELLLRAGEVVTRQELIQSIWPEVKVRQSAEQSLNVAVSKLRRFLGDDGDTIVATVHKFGYRLGVPVTCEIVGKSTAKELNFQVGATVPGRENWKFVKQLSSLHATPVWLAEHSKTGDKRVFKYAQDGAQLTGLKREVTLSRLFTEELDEPEHVVRVLDWKFDQEPFFLESAYGGPNMVEWAQLQGGLPEVSAELRIALLAEIATVVGKAHNLGALHRDLKPSNVLISGTPGDWCVVVADFGCASLTELSRLKDLSISNLGFGDSERLESSPLTGTRLYLAPEVFQGQIPTAAADVYALGVMLYQLAVGDFGKGLTVGWDNDIPDPVLRDDIGKAASGNPNDRLPSAAELAERLRTLDERRAKLRESELAAEQAERAQRKLETLRAKRPWAIAATVALVVGCAVSTLLYARAVHERNEADRQRTIAEEMNRFLDRDLLSQSDPFHSGKAALPFAAVVKQAASRIDAEFKAEPLIAARLHQTIANALASRTEYPDAAAEYAHAAALYGKDEGAVSPGSMIDQLQWAIMEALSQQPGSLDRAKTLFQRVNSSYPQLRDRKEEVAVWRLTAGAMIKFFSADLQSAKKDFLAALQMSKNNAAFDESFRLVTRQRLMVAEMHLGENAEAERITKELIPAFSRLNGPEMPIVLQLHLNLAEIYLLEGNFAKSVTEANLIYPKFVNALGEDAQWSLQVLATRAAAEGSEQLWEPAIRDDLTLFKAAARRYGPAWHLAVGGLDDAALSQCRSGHNAEGEATARKALQIAKAAYKPDDAIRSGTAYTLATCLINTGRFQEASKFLQTVNAAAVAQYSADPGWAVNLYLAQAQIAYGEHDYRSAVRLANAAATGLTDPKSDPYQRKVLRKLRANIDEHLWASR